MTDESAEQIKWNHVSIKCSTTASCKRKDSVDGFKFRDFIDRKDSSPSPPNDRSLLKISLVFVETACQKKTAVISTSIFSKPVLPLTKRNHYSRGGQTTASQRLSCDQRRTSYKPLVFCLYMQANKKTKNRNNSKQPADSYTVST